MNEIARREALQPTPIKTATVIRDVSEQNGATGVQLLVRVNPALTDRYDGDESTEHYEYVVASSTHAMFTGFETLVFPANEDGTIRSWGELIGGRGMTAREVFEEAGYEIMNADGI